MFQVFSFYFFIVKCICSTCIFLTHMFLVFPTSPQKQFNINHLEFHLIQQNTWLRVGALCLVNFLKILLDTYLVVNPCLLWAHD